MRAPLGLLFLLLCAAGAAHAADVRNVIEAVLQILYEGASLATLNAASVNMTKVVEDLNKLGTENEAEYGVLKDITVAQLTELYDSNNVDAVLCGRGSYVDPQSGVCTACPPGTYSLTDFATSPSACVKCAAGTFSGVAAAPNASVCQSCPAGTFSDVQGATNSSVCASCGAGATSVPGAQGLASCQCDLGYYGSISGGLLNCQPCEAGYWCALGVRTACLGHADGKSTSPARASAASQCYCRPGYYGWAYEYPGVPAFGCQDCPGGRSAEGGSYCDGTQSATLYGSIVTCPPNSASPALATQLSDCTCDSGYRTQYSAPTERYWDAAVDHCNCTLETVDGQPRCSVLDSPTCATCGPETHCAGGSTLTCKQGYLEMRSSSNFAASTSMSWIIAPAGAEKARATFTYVAAGGSGIQNCVTIQQCVNAACASPQGMTSNQLCGTISQLPRTFTTSTGFTVFKITFFAQAISTQNPFRLEYGSELPCTKTTVPGAPTSALVVATGESTTVPYLPDATWPIVAWLGDTLLFNPGTLSLDVRNASGALSGSRSVLNAITGIQRWQPTAVGSYWLVDRSYVSRQRQIVVVPVDPRRQQVWYDVSASAFLLSGDVVGSGSPDIVLVKKDVLVLTRLTSAHGLVLLSRFTNATSYALLGGAGVVGQSAVGRRETSLTWDTSQYEIGTYYYASIDSLGGVKVGRIVLHPLGGGQSCSRCLAGEFCYSGATEKCPANSRSPPGSDDVGDCVCAPGFAQSTVDLEAYSNALTVDSGGRHGCVISENATVWCWGANEEGQLGLGNFGAALTETPAQVPGVTGALHVSLGDDFTCVVYGAGRRVRCWGGNNFGQLGQDSTADRVTSFAGGADAKLGIDEAAYSTQSLACAGWTCCAIVERDPGSGSLVKALTCWGYGGNGQLGRGTSYTYSIGTGESDDSGFTTSNPRYSAYKTGLHVTISTVATLQSVTMAKEHGCVLGVQTNGPNVVYCWGDNQHGAVGAGLNPASSRILAPTLVSLGGSAKVVNCYDYVCCAVISGTYAVKCWGRAANGRLGVGGFDVGTTPDSMGANLQAVNLGPTAFALDVNVGSTQTCVLLSNNYVKCWGLIGANVVGDNPPVDLMDMLPNVALIDDRVALQINGKGPATCAITSDYRAICWSTGGNSNKEVGGAAVVSPALGGVTMALVGINATVLRTSGNAVQKNCVMCGKNTYCDGKGGLPASCPANTISPVQSTRPGDCKCVAGYKPSAAGDGSCSICSGREYCAVGQAFECQVNSATIVDGSSDVSACQCDKGYYYAGAAMGCTVCGLGRFKSSVGNAGNCTLCPAGTAVNAQGSTAESACAACPAGTSSAAGSATCVDCSEGTASGERSGSCSACAAGFFAGARAAACSPCPVGTYDGEPRDGRPETCQKCTAGRFSNTTNNTAEASCRLCPAGTFSGEAASACSSCAAGLYSVSGSVACQSCPPNSTSAGGTGLAGCQCLAGFFKVASGDGLTFTCQICPSGQFSAQGSDSCGRCPAGTVGSGSGATTDASCVDCGGGKAAAEGAAVCQTCPGSTFAPGPRSANCTPCALGWHSLPGKSACIPCLPGRYAAGPITSASGCLPCPAGKYCVGAQFAPSSDKLQQDCPLGTFANETGLQTLLSCRPCPPNSYCPSPTMRGICPPGTRSNASSVSQLACVCETGYICNYQKIVSAVVRLLMTKEEFVGDVRNQFLAAVASAARTTVDKVRITGINTVSTASRRLLQAGEVHVLMHIEDGSGHHLERDLGARLAGAGLLLGEGRSLAWIEPHHVEVLPTA